uniref:Uncharacterized protein n=1 Tax=Aegilops tauschii TaxID=37682 RepID=M8BFA0_AEGTA
MDPQAFVRLSVGQLGLRLPGASARKACHCEIRLRGFPVQIAPVPLANSSEFNIDPHANAAVFSLDEPGLKALPTSRASQPDHLGGQYWSSSGSGVEKETDMAGRRRERKGWKVAIHDLSGSAVAAAFMATPFVPATGCDTVARSNPGAWLIVRADTTDAAMFLALAAAVDLSVKACRPFRSKTAPAKKKTAAGSSSPDPLELDT